MKAFNDYILLCWSFVLFFLSSFSLGKNDINCVSQWFYHGSYNFSGKHSFNLTLLHPSWLWGTWAYLLDSGGGVAWETEISSCTWLVLYDHEMKDADIWDINIYFKSLGRLVSYYTPLTIYFTDTALFPVTQYSLCVGYTKKVWQLCFLLQYPLNL